MKIISLKGQNLASLAAPFEINFASGILADAGLLAICGNTGSGKSTLLYAICLSLFDSMPRFNTSRRGPAIGHSSSQENERLKSNDVRHILTRGAASCFSEVVFELDNKKQYSARWAVKRARGSASGRIQAQEMSLTDVETQQVLATKKSEVLAKIEQLIGLNYDQFRRSVLLAQGDFAAFLKAPAKERSELLERITGTQMYSELSKLAFLRAKDEEQNLGLLTSRLGEVTLLSGEQQQQLVSQLGAVNEQMSCSTEQATQLDWLEQKLQQTLALEQQIFDNQALCHSAEAKLTDHQQQAHQIEQVEHAQRARVVDEQIKFNSQEQQRQDGDVEQLKGTITKQQQQVDQVAAQVEKLHSAKTLAAQELQQQLPLLENAIARQFELNHLTQNIGHKSTQLAEITQQQTAVNRRLQRNGDNQQRQQVLVEQLTDYLNQHQHFSSLVHQITALEQGINDYLQDQANFKGYQQQSIEVSLAAETAKIKRAKFQADLTTAKTQHQQHQVQHQQLSRYGDGKNPGQLEQSIEHHQQRLSVLVVRQQNVTQGLQYHSLINDKRIQHQEPSEQLEQTKISYHHTREQLEKLTPAVDEAESALLGAQQIMSLTEHRAQLVPEQPCALCGSTEHPYASEMNLGERLVDQLAGRCHQLKQQTNQLNDKLSQLEAIGNQLVEQQSKIVSEIADFNLLIQALSEAVVSPQVLAQIDMELASAQQSLASLKLQHSEQLEISDQIRTIEAMLVADFHALELLNQNITQSNLQLDTCANELTLAKQYQEQLADKIQTRLIQLNGIYAQVDWPAILNTPALLDKFKQQLATDLEQYIEKSNYHSQLQTEQGELEQQYVAFNQELKHLTNQVQPLEQKNAQDKVLQLQWQQEIDQLCQGTDPK